MPSGPRLVLLKQQRAEQSYHGLAVGENADDALASADLFIEPLDTVRGAQARAVVGRQGEDGGGVVEAALKGRDRGRRTLLEVGSELRQEHARRLGVGGVEERAQPAVYLLLQGFGCRVGDVGRQMGLAALPGGALELQADRLHKPAVVIRDHYVDAGQPAALEPGEEAYPAAFRLAVAQLQPKDLAVAGRVHTDGEERTDRPYPPALTHLETQAIHH